MKNSDLYGIVTSQECAEMNEFSKLVGWEAEYHQLGMGKYQASLQFSLGSDIRVTHQTSNRGMAMGGVPPQDHLAVLLPIYTGRNSIIQGQVFGKNDIAVMHPGSQAQFRAPRNFQMITASMRLDRLVPSFRALTERELDRFVDQTAIVSLPPQVRQHMERLCRRVILLSKKQQDTRVLRFAIAEVEDALLDALSLGLTHQDHPEPCKLALRNRMRYLALAQEYIEAHLTSPLGIETLAENVGVSSRTLGYAFRDTLNTTPLQYIKSRRLESARQRLVQSEPGEISVTTIAGEYGFTHLGYFSQDYFAQFGEHPSYTLRSSARN